ncbi:copper-translocating P-type ATPase [Sulfurimonas sp. C5]|uniref:copper-transporting P-type ATPase n=1 Tax=Sulfurimonas sp. C5 TaxID=3036947 RepID=UPI0024548E91|nr:copper-translocating P-type ATPase [Sulfurimonas sp. C5]MDH4943930.1 copper-translocating P-type ATPase [Sulfurimonas sp. C5]
MNNHTYTCPMHPEVIQDYPGSCPKCGMALEPVIVENTDDDENNELNYMKQRFWMSLLFTLPVFIVSMSSDLAPEYIPQNISMVDIQWFLFLLASPVILWGGWPFLLRGYESIKTLNLNMFTLIAIGVSTAYLYSIVALLLPELFPPLMRTKDGLVHVYFEAAAVITTLVLLGQVLELKARSKTNSAIKTLLNLAPKHAHRIIDAAGNEETIPLDLIQVGDMLRIKPGEKIPVDGVVLEGKSNVDESMITGEPLLIAKSMDDPLIGATFNKNSTLVMKAERIGSDTMLAQIINMVALAQRSRAPIQKLADMVSAYFVPTVVAVAILAFFGWYMLGPEPRLAYAIVSAVSVLIIACPCALGLATPISIMVGTGRAALSGILIKDAKNLEIMEKINTLVVDKTGTLTEGKPKVTTFIVQNDSFDEKDVLKFTASLELLSEHPLAEAIVEHAKEQNVSLSEVKDFKAITGQGIQGTIENKKIVIGSEDFLNSLKITTQAITKRANSLREDGKTVIFIAIESQFSAIIGIEDPIKSSSVAAIKRLKEEGIKIVMLSGDNETTANAVAKKLDINTVYAKVMPDRKAQVINKLQEEGAIVAMAGDGINDAPALAQADIGIAMGTGTDVAIESAGITLIKGDLLGIVKVLKISRATMQNIKQNLFFAFVYNSIGVPIAAGVLYPFFGILLSPIIAATAMSFSSVSVIVNALRLKQIKI